MTLDEEEIKVLKEFADNLIAANRMQKLFLRIAMWIGSVFGAVAIVYQFWPRK